MPFGICTLSLAPCRAEPSDKGEMATQLLFGEHYEVLEKQAKWLRIRSAYDAYECWLDKKQHSEIDASDFEALQQNPPKRLLNYTASVKTTRGRQYILMGAALPDREITEWSLESENVKLSQPDSNLAAVAKRYLNAPYLWGGRSHFGIDCSGFTQMVFLLCGRNLLRDAHQQAEKGTPVAFEDRAEGDLAFFANEEGKITHVGIAMEEEKIIHASGRVRIDRLDRQGIINEESGSLSHRLHSIKKSA